MSNSSRFPTDPYDIPDPPGPPKIQGLDDGEVLTAGNLKRLTCTSIAGNPLATLKWYIGDKELNSMYVTRDNYASAELSFVPKWSDNGANIRCEATNLAMPKPEIDIRKLEIDFLPEQVKLSSRCQFHKHFTPHNSLQNKLAHFENTLLEYVFNGRYS